MTTKTTLNAAAHKAVDALFFIKQDGLAKPETKTACQETINHLLSVFPECSPSVSSSYIPKTATVVCHGEPSMDGVVSEPM